MCELSLWNRMVLSVGIGRRVVDPVGLLLARQVAVVREQLVADGLREILELLDLAEIEVPEQDRRRA